MSTPKTKSPVSDTARPPRRTDGDSTQGAEFDGPFDHPNSRKENLPPELRPAVKAIEAIEASRAGKTKLDLMGGDKSKLGAGWKNYDLAATEGIADDVANLNKHFKPGELAEVVANNPRADFIQHIGPLVEPGGTVTVRGTMSNKFFKQVWEGKAPGLEGFEVVSKTENVPKPDWFRQTGGKDPVVGTINEIVLRKK